MASRHAGWRRNERGGAMVETPFAVVIMAFLAMGIVTLTQALYVHLQLASGVRAGARYASRTDYDPAASPPSSSRRRSEQEVRAYTVEATGADLSADALTCDPRCVLVTVSSGGTLPNAPRGAEVTVRAETVVDNALYDIGASFTNALAGLLGQGQLLDPAGISVSAEALAILE